MKKTKVLLALGRHGCPEGRLRTDASFFRKSVLPFLDENSGKGKKVGLIYEAIIDLGMGSAVRERLIELVDSRDPDVEEPLRQLGRILEREERCSNDALRRVFGSRDKSQLEQACAYATESGAAGPLHGIANWGVEDRLLHMGPEELVAVIEHQDPLISCYLLWKKAAYQEYIDTFLDTLPYTDLLIPTAKLIWMEIQFNVFRDRGILELANRLVDEEGATSLVVLRGASHRGMAALFGPRAFDVTLADCGSPTDFTWDAVDRAYADEPGEDELLLFAELQLQLARMNSRALSIQSFETRLPLSFSDQEEILRVVKQRVIEANPIIADKLGL